MIDPKTKDKIDKISSIVESVSSKQHVAYAINNLTEDDKKPLMTWLDKLEIELKKLKGSYKTVKPTDALELYYAKVKPREAASKLLGKKLKESVDGRVSLYESQKKNVLNRLRSRMDEDWYKALKLSNKKQGLDKMIYKQLNTNKNNVEETTENLMKVLGRNHMDYLNNKRGGLHDKNLTEGYTVSYEMRGDKNKITKDVEKQFKKYFDGSGQAAGGRTWDMSFSVPNTKVMTTVMDYVHDNYPKEVVDFDHFRESVEHSPMDEASQRFGGDTNIPADKKTKAYIESGRAKILINVPSSLHPSARFVVAKNPNTGSNQDKVMMFTISDPDRGRIKMFSFHGSHVSHQKAMDFAKHHKLVTTKDAKGNPLYAKESVEHLYEAGDPRIANLSKKSKEMLASLANAMDTTGGPFLDSKNIKFLTKQGVDDTLEAGSKLNLSGGPKKFFALIKKELGESVELGEGRPTHPKIGYSKIMKGLRDSQGPFVVVAIRMGKVVSQSKPIKLAKLLPIEVNDMFDEYPLATIGIESKDGKMLNTFNESVELDEDRWKTIPGKEVAKRMRSVKSMKPYAAQVAKLKKVNAIDLERLLPHDKVSVKDIDRVMFWKESYLDERHGATPKATKFDLVIPFKGKDNKFVSRLTDLGGKVDRSAKTVVFNFKSGPARKKFVDANKSVWRESFENEGVEIDIAKEKETIEKSQERITGLTRKQKDLQDRKAKRNKVDEGRMNFIDWFIQDE